MATVVEGVAPIQSSHRARSAEHRAYICHNQSKSAYRRLGRSVRSCDPGEEHRIIEQTHCSNGVDVYWPVLHGLRIRSRPILSVAATDQPFVEEHSGDITKSKTPDTSGP